MARSSLKNKSEMLEESAQLLHQKTLYPGVAHAAYYSCFQLMKDICIFKIYKNEQEFNSGVSLSVLGSHEFVLNEIVKYIEVKDKSESRVLRCKIPQLKTLRVKADYKNEDFKYDDSQSSLTLSKEILQILKKY